MRVSGPIYALHTRFFHTGSACQCTTFGAAAADTGRSAHDSALFEPAHYLARGRGRLHVFARGGICGRRRQADLYLAGQVHAAPGINGRL